MIDLITLYHDANTWGSLCRLTEGLLDFENGNYRLIIESNRRVNRGFSAACNAGARRASTEIIGFVNPDLIICGPFLHQVTQAFATDPRVVIAGCAFNKPRQELDQWGLNHWVCGAALFTWRNWFEQEGGFDENLVWAWDDTDLCRRAELNKLIVKPLDLPLEHTSPTDDTAATRAYKMHWIAESGRRYYAKYKGLGKAELIEEDTIRDAYDLK